MSTSQNSQWILAVLLAAAVIHTCQAVCDQHGWFGDDRCLYKCHCHRQYGCDQASGECGTGTKCDPDFFGPSCQYESLKYTAPGKHWLTDGNDATCNNQPGDRTVTVQLDRPEPITWFRVVVSNPEHTDKFQVEYRTDANVLPSCQELLFAQVDRTTLDISCPTTESVTHLKLSGVGVGALCSLHISGGRNVALRQPARQSTTYKKWYASNAVDANLGRINGHDHHLEDACSHTEKGAGAPGWWSLKFLKPVFITKFVIFNRRNPRRKHCCESRLRGFTIDAFPSSSSAKIYSYIDRLSKPQSIYTVRPQHKVGPSVETVTITTGSRDDILTLCEVIIRGDTVCPAGKYGRECEHQCNCAGDSACFVHSGGCPSGCKPGFTGSDCWTRCPEGQAGANCSQTCSVHCAGPNNACLPSTGVCVAGCDPGFQPPHCVAKCKLSTYGRDCSEKCSTNCYNKECDAKTGKCDRCRPGYVGDFCDEECPRLTFGEECSRSCSSNCLNQHCNHVTGKCVTCPEGKTGDLCDGDPETGTEKMRTVIIGVVVLVAIILVVTITVALVCRRRRASGSDYLEPCYTEQMMPKRSNQDGVDKPTQVKGGSAVTPNGSQGKDSSAVAPNGQSGCLAYAVTDVGRHYDCASDALDSPPHYEDLVLQGQISN